MAAFGHVAQCTMPTPTALILEMDVAQARAPDMSAVLSRTALGASVQCQDPTSIPPVRRGRNTGDHFLSLSASVTVSTYADERDGGVIQGDDTALGSGARALRTLVAPGFSILLLLKLTFTFLMGLRFKLHERFARTRRCRSSLPSAVGRACPHSPIPVVHAIEGGAGRI
jgi:hypothetical protein